MHRKLEAELLSLDTELERTLRNLKKVRFAEVVVMAEQRETQQNIPVVAVDRPQGQRMSHPRSRSDPIGESEPVSGCETICWDSLFIYLFIFQS